MTGRRWNPVGGETCRPKIGAVSEPMHPSDPAIPAASYIPAGPGTFESTVLTSGPWDPGAQHAGPPCALIARALEDDLDPDRAGWIIGRVTYEILGSIPVGPLRVEVEVVRPGRSVELLEATLSAAGGDGRALIRARAWRLRAKPLELPGEVGSLDPGSPLSSSGRPSGAVGRPPPPGECGDSPVYFPTEGRIGWNTGLEMRRVCGDFDSPGPGVAWMRMRRPLVEGEDTSPLVRVLMVADAGNGLASPLDYRTHTYVNVDLTVAIHRPPEGEWICLDSVVVAEPTGTGISDSVLFDERGPVGRAGQTLLIDER